MLSVLDEAYKIGMINNGTVEDPAEAERNKLSAYRGFWSITLGGAEGLYIDDLVGNFAVGKEADFVALDCNGGPHGAGLAAVPDRRERHAADARAGRGPTVRRDDGG